VFAGHDGANAGFALGDGWEGYAGGHNACVEEGAGEVHGAAAVADDDGSDGGFTFGSCVAADVEACIGELLLEVGGVGPEAFDSFGLGLEDVEGGDACRGDRGWMRGGEEEGAGTVVEVVDEIATAADVATEGSDGFGECADLDVDFVGGVKVIDGAATVATKDSARVGVVDHHDGAVLFAEIGELVDGPDVAVHGEDAVGDEELAAGLVLDLLEELLGVGDVFVAEDFDLCSREACAVDDAGVVELVGEDEVFFAEDAGDGAGVGGEAGLEDDAGLDALEGGDLFFELYVDVHGAGDGADCSGAYAVFFCGGDGGFFEARVVAEAEVVVGGEVDDTLAVVGADGGLLIVEYAQLEEGAALAEVVELGGEMGKLGAFGGCGGHEIILNLLWVGGLWCGMSILRSERLCDW
jgi:hypothetical protein